MPSPLIDIVIEAEMRIYRRHFLRAVLGGMAILNTRDWTAHAGSFMKNTIDVIVKVQDETGQPIPFVSVWQGVQVSPAHDRGAYLDLTMQDLWRITTRYQDTFEFVISYGEKPVPHLRVPEMGDQQGNVRHVVDYENMTGSANHYVRPDPLVVSYTFMKQGYLPGKLEFVLSQQDGSAEGVVTLKSDPKVSVRSTPYLQEYDRIRWELSNTKKNTALTMENHNRLEEFRKELEQLAGQAIAAGDKKAAARFYTRMKYLPELTFIDGRIAGFKQTNPQSERNKEALQKAFELDPANLFVWMNTIFKRASIQASTSQQDKIKQNVVQLDRLIEQHGEAAWPEIYRWRAGSYANLGEFVEAQSFYLEAAKLEPKFANWQRYLDELKQKMLKQGVSVPAS